MPRMTSCHWISYSLQIISIMQAYEYAKTYLKEDKDDRDSVQLVYEQDTHDCLIQVSTALVYCDLDG